MSLPFINSETQSTGLLSGRVYQAMMENLADAVILLGSDQEILYQSPSVERISGFSPEEMRGKTILDWIHPKEVKSCIDFFEQLIKEPGKPRHFTYRLPHKSGHYIWIEGSVTNLLHDQHIRGFVLNYRDVSERMKQEEQIITNEKRYQHLIQHLPAAVYTCDTDGKILLYNKAAVTLWGREPKIGADKWCGSWQIFKADGSPIRLDESPMARAIAEGNLVCGEEIVIRRRDGSMRDVKSFPTPLFDSSGQVCGGINMLLDVTEKKKAFERVRLQRKAIDSAVEGVLIMDALQAGNPIIFANKGFCNLTDYTQQELMGNTLCMLTGEETDPDTVNEINQCIRDHGYFEGEIIHYKKDLAPFWDFLRIAPVPDDTGEIRHFVCFINDITPRKAIEFELKRTLEELEIRVEERTDELSLINNSLKQEMQERIAISEALFVSRDLYSKTLQSIADAVIATDASGMITFMNNAAEMITGVGMESAQGKPVEYVFKLVDEETLLPVENPVRSVLLASRGTVAISHGLLQTGQNDFTYIDDNAAPIHNDKGEIMGAVVVFRDITEQTTNRKKLENAYAEIEITNKHITDSIRYAQSLQKAFFPDSRKLKTHFPKSFVINRPQHIVGGDFYWINKTGEKIMIASVDCTGHSVPGAFMSIIAIELLNKIVGEQDCQHPAQVLQLMDQGIANSIGMSNPDGVADGMDMSFCVIDQATRKIRFAGAMNPIIFISGGEVHVIKGSRHCIGGHHIYDAKQFETHEFDYRKGDMLYMFTDGYKDQFGGEHDKKFTMQRFTELLHQNHLLSPRQQKDALVETLETWKGDRGQTDDIMVIGMEL